jgi:hypothetical protein
MRFQSGILVSLIALSLFLAGCETRIPKEELGNVRFEIPAVPGAEKPPATPELEGLDTGHDPKTPHQH